MRARQCRSDKPDSSMKTITGRCRAAIFLARATFCSSRCGSLLRRAAELAALDVAGSTASFAGCAAPRIARTSPQNALGSRRQFAATSTFRSRIRRPTNRRSTPSPTLSTVLLTTARPTGRLGSLQALHTVLFQCTLPAHDRLAGRVHLPQPASLQLFQSLLGVHPYLEFHHSKALDRKRWKKCHSITEASIVSVVISVTLP